METIVRELNNVSITSSDFNEMTKYLASVDPSFAKGLNLLLSGECKTAEDVIEATMDKEDVEDIISNNCGEMDGSSILEKIDESKLRNFSDTFIADVVSKFGIKDVEGLTSTVIPDSKPVENILPVENAEISAV